MAKAAGCFFHFSKKIVPLSTVTDGCHIRFFVGMEKTGCGFWRGHPAAQFPTLVSSGARHIDVPFTDLSHCCGKRAAKFAPNVSQVFEKRFPIVFPSATLSPFPPLGQDFRPGRESISANSAMLCRFFVQYQLITSVHMLCMHMGCACPLELCQPMRRAWWLRHGLGVCVGGGGGGDRVMPSLGCLHGGCEHVRSDRIMGFCIHDLIAK